MLLKLLFYCLIEICFLTLDLWPEEVVISKFYNRNKTSNNSKV